VVAADVRNWNQLRWEGDRRGCRTPAGDSIHVRFAIVTEDLFGTGRDEANRAAVAAVAKIDLDRTVLAFRAYRKDADKITNGLRMPGRAGRERPDFAG
jgi:hypothetical protein